MAKVLRGKPFSKGRIPWNKGKKLSLEHRLKLSEIKRGLPPEKHNCWKGDKAGYFALHLRVYKKRGNPQYCEKCGTNDKRKRYEWANITGNYTDIMDYRRLCQSCHRKSHTREKGYKPYAKRKVQ